MSIPDPIHMNAYTKTETDLKMELLTKTLDSRFDRLDHRVDMLSREVKAVLWLMSVAIISWLAYLAHYFSHTHS